MFAIYIAEFESATVPDTFRRITLNSSVIQAFINVGENMFNTKQLQGESTWRSLTFPFVALAGLVAGCEVKKENFITGEVIRNDKNEAARLTRSPGGLFASETVKIGGDKASIQVRTSTGEVYSIELFDGDTLNQNDRPRTCTVHGPATVSNTILALGLGSQIRFPSRLDGCDVFDSSRRGLIEVDAIEIVKHAEKK